MAYVVGALRTVMEWATVPVLAVAMCLPHGALVYWLSSSSVSLLQVPNPAMPSARSTEAHMQSSVCHPACLYNRRGFACEHGCWRPSALMSGHGLTSRNAAAQSAALRRPAIRSALRLSSQDPAGAPARQDWSTATATASEHARADADGPSTAELFLQVCSGC